MRQSLVHVDDYVPRGDIGLCFIDQLPIEEVIGYLKKKLEVVEKLLSTYENTPKHVKHAKGVNLTIEHRIALFRCDRAWLSETIDKLSAEGDEVKRDCPHNVRQIKTPSRECVHVIRYGYHFGGVFALTTRASYPMEARIAIQAG